MTHPLLKMLVIVFILSVVSATYLENDVGSFPQRDTFSYDIRVLPSKYDLRSSKNNAIPSGTYFRVELSVRGVGTHWQLLNTSAGGAGLMLIKAYKYGIVHNQCNTTEPWEVLDTVTDLGSADGVTQPDAMLDRAYATFEAPTVPFKICYRKSVSRFFNATIKKLDWTRTFEWRSPNNDDGFVRHVNSTDLFYRAPSPLLAHDFGVLQIIRRNASFHHALKGSTSLIDSDTIKLVASGTKCIQEESMLAYGGTFLTSAGSWSNSGLEASAQNAFSGTLTGAGTDSLNWLSASDSGSSVAAHTSWAYFRVPDVGSYDVCYSSFAERRDLASSSAMDQSPVWRKLVSVSSPHVSPLSISKRTNAVTVQVGSDVRESTWGSVHVTGEGLNSNEPSRSDHLGFYPTQEGGDTLKLVPSTVFATDSRTSPSGCFYRASEHVVESNPGDEGTNTVRLSAAPTTSETPWLSQGTSTSVYAYLRFPPNTTTYHVCYRRANENWHLARNSSGGVLSLRSAMLRKTLRLELNDTTELSYAQLKVLSDHKDLNTMRNSYSIPTDGAVALRVVSSTGNCQQSAAFSETWNTGIGEEAAAVSMSHSTTDLRSSVVAYVQIPQWKESGFRVCVRVGTKNWVAVGSIHPKVKSPFTFSAIDLRAHSMAKVAVQGCCFSRNVQPFLKVIANTSFCAAETPSLAVAVQSLYETKNRTSFFVSIPAASFEVKFCLKQKWNNWMETGRFKPWLFAPLSAGSLAGNGLGGSVQQTDILNGVSGEIVFADNATNCYSTQTTRYAVDSLGHAKFHLRPVMHEQVTTICYREGPSFNWYPIRTLLLTPSDVWFATEPIIYKMSPTTVGVQSSSKLIFTSRDKLQVVPRGTICGDRSRGTSIEHYGDANVGRGWAVVFPDFVGEGSVCYWSSFYNQWLLIANRNGSETLLVSSFPAETVAVVDNRTLRAGMALVRGFTVSGSQLSSNDTAIFVPAAIVEHGSSGRTETETNSSCDIHTFSPPPSTVIPIGTTTAWISATLSSTEGMFFLCYFSARLQRWGQVGRMFRLLPPLQTAVLNDSSIVLSSPKREFSLDDEVRILHGTANCTSNASSLWSPAFSMPFTTTPENQLVTTGNIGIEDPVSVCLKQHEKQLWTSVPYSDERIQFKVAGSHEVAVRFNRTIAVGTPTVITVLRDERTSPFGVSISTIGMSAIFYKNSHRISDTVFLDRSSNTIVLRAVTECEGACSIVVNNIPYSVQMKSTTPNEISVLPPPTHDGYFSNGSPANPWRTNVFRNFSFDVTLLHNGDAVRTSGNATLSVSHTSDFSSVVCASCAGSVVEIVEGVGRVDLHLVETQRFVFRRAPTDIVVSVSYQSISRSITLRSSPVFMRQLVVKSLEHRRDNLPIWVAASPGLPSSTPAALPNVSFVSNTPYTVVLEPQDTDGMRVSPQALAGDSVSASSTGGRLIDADTQAAFSNKPPSADGCFRLSLTMSFTCSSCTLVFISSVYKSTAQVTSPVSEKASRIALVSSFPTAAVLNEVLAPVVINAFSGAVVTESPGIVCVVGFPKEAFPFEWCQQMFKGTVLFANLTFVEECNDCHLEFLSSIGGGILSSPTVVVRKGPYKLHANMLVDDMTIAVNQSVEISLTASRASGQIASEAQHWIYSVVSHFSNDSAPMWTLQPARVFRLDNGIATVSLLFHEPCANCTVQFDVKSPENYDQRTSATPYFQVVSSPNATTMNVAFPASFHTNRSSPVNVTFVDSNGFATEKPDACTFVILSNTGGSLDGSGGNLTAKRLEAGRFDLTFSAGCLTCTINVTCDQPKRGMAPNTRHVDTHVSTTASTLKLVSDRNVSLVNYIKDSPSEKSALHEVRVLRVDESGVFASETEYEVEISSDQELLIISDSNDFVLNPNEVFKIHFSNPSVSTVAAARQNGDEKFGQGSFLIAGMKSSVKAIVELRSPGTSSVEPIYISWGEPQTPSQFLVSEVSSCFPSTKLSSIVDGRMTTSFGAFAVDTRSSFLIGIEYPICLSVVGSDGRRVFGFSGSVSISPSAFRGCSPDSFSTSTVPIVNGNGTALMVFKRPSSCVLTFTLRSSQSFPAVRSFSKEFTSVDSAPFKVSVQPVAHTQQPNQEFDVVLHLMASRGNDLVPYPSTAKLVPLTARLRKVWSTKSTEDGDGGVVKISGSSTVSSYTTIKVSFSRSCYSCRLALELIDDQNAIVTTALVPTTHPSQRNIFEVSSEARHIFLAWAPDVVQRGEAFQVIAAFGASSNDVLWSFTGMHSEQTIALQPHGGNGGGGLLLHSNGGEELTESMWYGGYQVWRLAFSLACDTCYLFLGNVPVSLAVSTTAAGFRVSAPQLAVEVGSSINITIEAVDQYGSIDYSFTVSSLRLILSSSPDKETHHDVPGVLNDTFSVEAAFERGKTTIVFTPWSPLPPSYLLISSGRLSSKEKANAGQARPPMLSITCQGTQLFVYQPLEIREGNTFVVKVGVISGSSSNVCPNSWGIVHLSSKRCNLLAAKTETTNGVAIISAIFSDLNAKNQSCDITASEESVRFPQHSVRVLAKKVTPNRVALVSSRYLVAGTNSPSTVHFALMEDSFVDTTFTGTCTILTSPMCRSLLPRTLQLSNGRGHFTVSFATDMKCPANITVSKFNTAFVLVGQVASKIHFGRNFSLPTALHTGKLYNLHGYVLDKYGAVVAGASTPHSISLTTSTQLSSNEGSGPTPTIRDSDGAIVQRATSMNGELVFSLSFVETSEEFFNIVLHSSLANVELGPHLVVAVASHVLPSPGHPFPSHWVSYRSLVLNMSVSDQYGNSVRDDTFMKLDVVKTTHLGSLSSPTIPTLSGTSTNGSLVFPVVWAGRSSSVTVHIKGAGLKGFTSTIRFQEPANLKILRVTPENPTQLREFERVSFRLALVDEANETVVGDSESIVEAVVDPPNATHLLSGDPFNKTVSGGFVSFTWFATRASDHNYTVHFTVSSTFRTPPLSLSWNEKASTQVVFKSDLLGLSMLAFPSPNDFNASLFKNLIANAAQVETTDVVVVRVCPEGQTEAELCVSNSSVARRRFSQLENGVYVEFHLQLSNISVGADGIIANAISLLQTATLNPNSDLSLGLKVLSSLQIIEQTNSGTPPPSSPSEPSTGTPSPTRVALTSSTIPPPTVLALLLTLILGF